MTSPFQDRPLVWPKAAWLIVIVSGLVAPAAALLLILPTPDTYNPDRVIAPVLAVGLMGAGMIGSAVSGRFGIGVLLAILAAICLTLVARSLVPAMQSDLPSMGIAIVIASVSFAARGALFARSSGGKGWWIAVAVVAGEAAILLTALAQPGALPDWLLVLLPAQWANMAIQTALAADQISLASAPLIALAGTAAATLMVTRLWPRRWPYLIMFSTWVALSALVYHTTDQQYAKATTNIVMQGLVAEEGLEPPTRGL